MPPRLARSSVQTAAPKNAKNKNRKRTLDAYSIASHSTKDRKPIASHRLGESLDDNPRQKRRRDEDDEDDASEDDSAPRRKIPKGRGRGIAEEGDGVEEGSDSEGNEWTLGGLAEDDEDSDLDSDEAFGESDEERFEGFTFRGSSGGKAKKTLKKKQRVDDGDGEGEIDLDEADAEAEEDEEEDDFGDEGVDLATMLDDDDEDVLGGKDPTEKDTGEESSSEDDDEDESASEAESEDEENKSGDEERLARLRDRLEAMDSKQTPNSTAPADTTGALSVDDLLADLDPAARKQYTAALKTKRKSQAPKTLTAPLPKRQQDRLNREAASQKAKEQLDRWRDTVVHNRRAEFLSFPLQDPDRAEPIGKAKFDTQGAPQNELEESVRRIMEESGMASKSGQHAADEDDEDAMMKAEELATNHLPVEEVMRRRAELRRTRELLFREEIKAKRIAKIKSKSYRRVHRKERERLAEKERALMDPEGLGLPVDEDERESNDRKRAEERMGTKHRESKWAKSLKATNRTVWDEGARGSVLEEARRREELRRRIAGEAVEGDDGEEGSDVPSNDSAGEDGVQMLKRIGRLGAGAGPQKGVGGMKFMQAAEERKRVRNEEDVERLRKELAVADGDEVDGEDDQSLDEGIGRALFGPKGKEGREAPMVKQKRPELEEGDVSEDEADDGDNERQLAGIAERPQQQLKKPAPKGILKNSKGTSGPLAKGLLPRDRRDPEAARQEGEGAVSSWLTDAGAKKSKGDRRREREGDGEAMIVTGTASTDKLAKASASKPSKPAKAAKDPAVNGVVANNTDGWQTVANTTANPANNNNNNEDDENDVSDPEPTANPLLTPAQAQASSYHRRAFAADDVQTAFALEKAADAASEGEHETSTHLPGWGSWTGSGLSKSIRKSNARARHNPLYKTKLPGGVKQEDRKDAKLGERVIVSEKVDRKGRVYRAPVLPQGFERGEQYERSLRVPVGPEWTTKEVFQRGTRPRVVVRPGVVVEAMGKPIV